MKLAMERFMFLFCFAVCSLGQAEPLLRPSAMFIKQWLCCALGVGDSTPGEKRTGEKI
jgi:hypothetical protein